MYINISSHECFVAIDPFDVSPISENFTLFYNDGAIKKNVNHIISTIIKGKDNFFLEGDKNTGKTSLIQFSLSHIQQISKNKILP